MPTLVLLKIKRAALCCKWSPDGKAFAVGSSERKRMSIRFYPSNSAHLYLQHLREFVGESKRTACKTRERNGGIGNRNAHHIE